MTKKLIIIMFSMVLLCFSACSENTAQAESAAAAPQNASDFAFTNGETCSWYCKNCRMCVKITYDITNCPSCGKKISDINENN